MHFSKTYEELLGTLPRELRETTVEYKHLKKIINQIVQELSSLGLNPGLLQELLEYHEKHPPAVSTPDNQVTDALTPPSTSARVPGPDPSSINSRRTSPTVVYEFSDDSSRIESRLRVPTESLSTLDQILHSGETEGVGGDGNSENEGQDHDGASKSEISNFSAKLTKVINSAISAQASVPSSTGSSGFRPLLLSCEKDVDASDSDGVIIPLASDSQFFELLHTGLQNISGHLKSIEADFRKNLKELSAAIGACARPASSSKAAVQTFRAWSPLKDNPGFIRVRYHSLSDSDLYSWREIFQLYMELEIFQSTHEMNKGERSLEESEQRLELFKCKAVQRGFTGIKQSKLKLGRSRRVLERFLELNTFVLNIQKFQFANSEATRKILKKHKKRTALRLPQAPSSSSSHSPPQLALLSHVPPFTLHRILIQAIGETLIPIIPHLDDYSCLICTTLAFKPIRLDCKHLFCIRCLVKMQKRGQGDCPMCRAPSVLIADRDNVDWALMNFMQDWFPREAKEKLKENEKESNAELLAELGLDPNTSCTIM